MHLSEEEVARLCEHNELMRKVIESEKEILDVFKFYIWKNFSIKNNFKHLVFDDVAIELFGGFIRAGGKCLWDVQSKKLAKVFDDSFCLERCYSSYDGSVSKWNFYNSFVEQETLGDIFTCVLLTFCCEEDISHVEIEELFGGLYEIKVIKNASDSKQTYATISAKTIE